jgi:hypothetical protein
MRRPEKALKGMATPRLQQKTGPRLGPIGVDLDNTIVSYDEVLSRVARERGLVGPGIGRSKKAIRDAIRRLPDGEIHWQKLQAVIYGPRMAEARLIDGVADFFRSCRRRSVQLYVVSHKTEFANYDTTRTNLRSAAMDWLEQQGFFDPQGMGLNRGRVYFESTRSEKIERIKDLGCTHFIDDLEETFLEDGFPPEVAKILFDPHRICSPMRGSRICSSWEEIITYLLRRGHGESGPT